MKHMSYHDDQDAHDAGLGKLVVTGIVILILLIIFAVWKSLNG